MKHEAREGKKDRDGIINFPRMKALGSLIAGSERLEHIILCLFRQLWTREGSETQRRFLKIGRKS